MTHFNVLPSLPIDQVHFLCIGTDRSTGDALVPLVGTRLKDLGYQVTGTIEEPCHAMNLIEWVSKIPSDKTIIAIDASLGSSDKVGQINVRRGAIKPGAGVGKDLGDHGDYSITAVVNVAGYMEYFVLSNTRLAFVMSLANQIVEGINSKYKEGLA